MAIWFNMMAGDDRVCSVRIGRVRTSTGNSPDSTHLYHWTIMHPDHQQSWDSSHSGYLEHRESDGAEHLVWLALSAYLAQAKAVR
jgi:hypothetical protein